MPIDHGYRGGGCPHLWSATAHPTQGPGVEGNRRSRGRLRDVGVPQRTDAAGEVTRGAPVEGRGGEHAKRIIPDGLRHVLMYNTKNVELF
jgi:hypothetical protein